MMASQADDAETTTQTSPETAHDAGTKLIYDVLVSTGGVGVRGFTLTLLDSNGQSSVKTTVAKPDYGGFCKDISFEIPVEKELADIALVKIDKDTSQWYCCYIKVKTPSGKCFEFPCYRWKAKDNEIVIREGTARLPQDETEFLKKQRENELETRKDIFRWIQGRTGFPNSIDPKQKKIPLDVQFDGEKQSDFSKNLEIVGKELGLGRYKDVFQPWKDFADFEKIFSNYKKNKNPLLENVMQDWNTDYMFGYQFLNGCNPVMIKKCKKIPEKFPVTHEMVKGFLQRGLTLQEEIEKGNLYIVDYEILEGLEANNTVKYRYYLTAPICLLYYNRLNQIVPIAIQLSQTPGETSPIFLPDDNEYDWMLAKMWVRTSDFNLHQLVTHLLKTHLISEVVEIAMYRQLSTAHPVYKLLIPHVRFTMAINAEGRVRLISDKGFFNESSNISKNGIDTLMERTMKTLTFKSLCFPETIKARDMENAPKYYYRDDGMRIWEAINCFVADVVEIYYDGDEQVEKDLEIQGFVKNISFGMCDSESKKFPQTLATRAELIEYLTTVIFTASAQHAAVNFGQFDWFGWIPNSPSTMRKPPPKKKGEVDLKFIMDSLPDLNASSGALAITWALSQFQENERYLGTYPEVRFTEPAVKEAIKKFGKNLDELTDSIKRRNEELTMGYWYLSPDKIPNSVAI